MDSWTVSISHQSPNSIFTLFYGRVCNEDEIYLIVLDYMSDDQWSVG